MWRIVWHDGFGGTQTGETSLRPHDFVRGLERRPDWWWIFGSYRALCDCGPR